MTTPRIVDRRTPDPTEDPVCAFYTTHPYPAPIDNLDRARTEWQDPNRDRAEYHLYWPEMPYRADLDVLIAGCGTWQAAKYAVCRPGAHVVGIDISQTSLEHTERLQDKYGLTNLELCQLPVEQADTLERRFDLIICTGVLHHLADPDTGLRALRTALKPRGAILLMVYGRYGRTGIYMLQDYCRRLGVGTSRREMSDLMEVLEALPSVHPAVSLLRHARDSRNADTLADALLNPREESYSVPQFFHFVERNGLTLGRWRLQAPYLPQCGAMATTQHADRLIALPKREQYAAMELWRGTMAQHSAVVVRRDTSVFRGTVSFDNERWREYVPLRFPSTVCVTDRLPPAAAALLVNRGHLYHDLVLVVGSEERQMVDAIDGQRTIAEIADITGGPETRPRARKFFEKLWRYDQVVFDASNAGL